MVMPASASEFFDEHVVATLPAPWSLAFLPDGRMLVSERPAATAAVLNPTAEGHIRVVTQAGAVSAPLSGLPANVGVLDIKLDPHFDQNHVVYFSFMERDPSAPRVGRDAGDSRVDPAGLALARAVLDVDGAGGPTLTSMSVIWHQTPKIVSFPGSGEPGGRIAFSPDGQHLFLAAGDRQEYAPVQQLDTTLGKIIRLNLDGSVPADNPYVNVPGARPEIWSLGHRNPYGLVFDANGVLWENEMGPKGGDELNAIVPTANYGWPNVSYGNNYDDTPIPKPSAGDGYQPAAHWWDPVIAPSGMIAYSGDAFPQWRGDLILSGLQSGGLEIVAPDGSSAVDLGRISLGARTRDVVQGPDGSLWVLFDQPDGRLVQLRPADDAGSAVLHNQSLTNVSGDGRSDVLWRNADGTVTAWVSAGSGFADGSGFTRVVPASWAVAGTGDFDRDGRTDVLWRNADGTVTDWLSSGSGFSDNAGGIFRKVSLDWTIAGTGDFDGDGRADILWRNADGTVTDWLSNGSGFSDNAAGIFRKVSQDWIVAATGDFNGDGRADILWRNLDGTVTDWLSNGTGFNDNAGAIFRKAGADWHIQGVGDFNGDGRADILWRDDDGTVTTWLSTGTGFASNNAGLSRAVPLDWRVVGIGDYNGDGKDDILWRNADGRVTDWLSTGVGFADNDAAIRAVPASWNVQQSGTATADSLFTTADFNGDGKTDILWRLSSGTVTDWLSTGHGFASNDSGVFREVGLDWRIVGTGDFNGDGKADILWRNANGAVTDWLSTGQGFASNDSSIFRAVAADWHVEATGDFNGDGKADILWRNADGTVTDWLSNGSGFTDNPLFSRQVGADWRIEASGDFNGDGRADILWRNADGVVTDWLSTGTGFSDNDGALFRAVTHDWRIEAVGDFNGDGRTDILWRNADGTVADWLSNGDGFSDNAASSRQAPADWHVTGVGDYDGDGKADILWRDDGGTVTEWLSTGAAFVDSDSAQRAVVLDWTIQHHAADVLI